MEIVHILVIYPKDLSSGEFKLNLSKSGYKKNIEVDVVFRNGEEGVINFLKNNKKFNNILIYSNQFSDEQIINLSKQIINNNLLSCIEVVYFNNYQKKTLNTLIENNVTNIVLEKDFSFERVLYFLNNKKTKFEVMSYLDILSEKNMETDSKKIDYIKESLKNCSPSKFNETFKFLTNDLEESLKQELLNIYASKNNEKNFLKEKNSSINQINRIISVWGNYEFACELAYSLSTVTNLNVLLIDADRLNPSVDMYMDINKFNSNIQINNISTYNSGINILLDAIEKKIISREIFENAVVKIKKRSNLSIITGNYNLNNYEYYEKKDFEKLISLSRDYFDIVIIILNKHIYDMFTVISLLKSDVNLIPIATNLLEVREFNKYIEFLNKKQKMLISKNYMVAFNHKLFLDIDYNLLHEASNCGFIGKIRYKAERNRIKSTKNSINSIIKTKDVKEYIKIINKLNIKIKAKYTKHNNEEQFV
ncbi:hypothetical protein [Helicovermis profundi]|uniref:AAA domain-containing protein n=1 Tax=Helicovermis profundi TaxID=3065157 RepID=A0AAU9E6N7_9FIRM|nr:hypothetical protein HLPR_27620 [Clostridia bacterium S502]